LEKYIKGRFYVKIGRASGITFLISSAHLIVDDNINKKLPNPIPLTIHGSDILPHIKVSNLINDQMYKVIEFMKWHSKSLILTVDSKFNLDSRIFSFEPIILFTTYVDSIKVSVLTFGEQSDYITFNEYI
jgi:hypothetical protein